MVLDMVLIFWCRNDGGGKCGGAEIVVVADVVVPKW
jgi:hypothetical protein